MKSTPAKAEDKSPKAFRFSVLCRRHYYKRFEVIAANMEDAEVLAYDRMEHSLPSELYYDGDEVADGETRVFDPETDKWEPCGETVDARDSQE